MHISINDRMAYKLCVLLSYGMNAKDYYSDRSSEIHTPLHFIQNLRLELLFDAGLRDMFFCKIPNSSFKLWPSRLVEAVKHVKFIYNQFFRNIIASLMQIHDLKISKADTKGILEYFLTSGHLGSKKVSSIPKVLEFLSRL